jgi:formylglycine-generating enzyme required for sulfatase activity
MIYKMPYDLTLETASSQLAEIPGGEILLRDDRIGHKWSVEIKPFLLSRYPITQDIYLEITGESPATFKGDKRPVETVSWKDAVSFCNSLSSKTGLEPCYHLCNETDETLFDPWNNGYRLPTEAEWEYACKAGTTVIRYGEIDAIAWYRENSGGHTHDVGTKMPNAWGLYDMLGNVWEWCSDIYDATTYGSYRILRGGGWNDVERGCMATNRRRSHPVSFRIDDLGFRIARNLH